MSSPIKSESYFAEGFEELDRELQAVTDVLAEAVPLDAGLLSCLPWRSGQPDAGACGTSPSETAQLLSVAFELLNLVEERVAFQFRSRRRAKHGPGAVNGLWPSVLGQLASAGCNEGDLLAALGKVQVEPVLTAHPTEAKRPEVREKHLSVYNTLVEWEAATGDAHRVRRLRSTLRSELEALWFTGEIYIRRPAVNDELQNAIYYLREVFPEAVLRLDSSLEIAWADAGFSVDRLRSEGAYPQVRFCTWIGGDRDGHPFVTPGVTAHTLDELRRHAARLHRRWTRRSAEALTLAPPFADLGAQARESLRALADRFGDAGHAILARNEHEPWRGWLYLLREKLGRLPESGGYREVAEYVADLEEVRGSLLEAGAGHTAREWINPLVRLAEVFRFQLAAVDVRQNSAAYDRAAADLFAQAGIPDGAGFAGWPEERRMEFLLAELDNPRPLLAPNQPLGEDAARAIEALRVLSDHHRRHGSDGLGQLIVSMTRQASDLLLVHLLCRESGLAERHAGGRWRSLLPVSPLFETGADLEASGRILGEYLGAMGPDPRGVQPAMVGYSDSNKDAGVFASQWGIFKAQEAISDVCRKSNVTPKIFHGRGGTIGRGAGPIQWFLKALPPGSLEGPVRLTEQGEVLPRKYAQNGNAHYHLETLVAGVTGAVAHSPATPALDEHRPALEAVARESAAAYRRLWGSERFAEFHRSATPIDALEAGTFGSRPPRRTGGGTLDDLRAIPWVFSWTQARFYLPGWFGVGSGLEALRATEPDAYEKLKTDLRQLNFLRYVLTNVESSLASADLELMDHYAGLCTDGELRGRVLATVRDEFARTRSQLAAFLGGDFATRRPRMNKTLKLREEPLRQLHHQQVDLLARWRDAGRPVESDPGTGKFDRLFLALQLTINAVSSGLRETG